MPSAIVPKLVFALAFAHASVASAHPPPFYWMADLSLDRRAGVQLIAGNPTLPTTPTTDTFAFAVDLSLEYGISDKLGIHAHLPLSLVRFDEDVGGDDSAGAVGNLALGVQVTNAKSRRRRQQTRLGASAVLYLPTASDDGASAAAAAATAQLYLPNLGLWARDTTTLRLRGDARYEGHSVFLQGEADLDFHFRDGDDDDVNLVLGVGPGVMLSSYYALLLELTFVDVTDDTVTTLDLGMRYHSPSVMIGARLYVPLDDGFRDNDLFGVAFDIGARF